MIRPTGRALAVLLFGLPAAAAPTLVGAASWWPLWLSYVVAFAGALVVEFAAMPTRRFLQIDLEAPPIVPLGEPAALRVVATASRRARLDLLVTLEGEVEQPSGAHLEVGPDGPTEVALPMRARRRGIVRCTARQLRWHGPFGLLACEVDEPLDLETRIVPNVGAARRRALRLVDVRGFGSGLKVERYVGDGSEFESLREFVVGMDRRSIDWKATARHRTLLCREFRAERDHMVVLCVDTGRLMGEPLLDAPRLDHAILAALELGHVCLRTGDRVGLYAFADQPQCFVPPQSGVHVMHEIQARAALLDYGTGETNFTLGVTDLLQRLRRRSLVVLFTDFVDSVTAELMIDNVAWLARRHVLLFVAMRDPLLDELRARDPASAADVHRAVVADEIHRERELVLERIRRAGAQVLDAGVDELGPGLIDRYLQVKRRELV